MIRIFRLCKTFKPIPQFSRQVLIPSYRNHNSQPNRESVPSLLKTPLSKIPRITLILGLSGTLPFSFALACPLLDPSLAVPCLEMACIYGGCIASFMGGIYWLEGVKRRQGWLQIAAVLPPLIMFCTSFLSGSIRGMATLGTFYAILILDYAIRDIADWWLNYRLLITTVITIGLGGASGLQL